MKYRWLREGQIVRIRSATLENYEKAFQTFGLKAYSNILSLPYPSFIGKNLKIAQNEAMKELDHNLIAEDYITHPVVATHITNPDYKKLPIVTL
jgi:hypothetical protein